MTNMLQETLKTVFLDIECFIYTTEKDQMYCSHLCEIFIRSQASSQTNCLSNFKTNDLSSSHNVTQQHMQGMGNPASDLEEG